MNLDKAELRMQLAQTWGKKFEAMQEAAKLDYARLEGGIQGLQRAADAMESHKAYYQKQVDADEITVPECSFAMRVIDRCIGGIQNLIDTAKVNQLLKQGEVRAFEKSLDVLEKDYKAELERLEALSKMVEEGGTGRPDDTPAVADISRRRKAAKKLPIQKVEGTDAENT